jgi:tetratricopeptide (TPR) repeat protein
MCSATPWRMKGASIALALCLFPPNRTTLAEDALWQNATKEAKQLREQGRYTEAEKAHLLALAEAEKFGPEDPRLALTLNGLAVLYHSKGQLSEAEPLYRRALAIGKNFPSVSKSLPS